MKKTLFIATLALGGMLAMSSCDSRQKLSDNIQGVWAGNPEEINDAGATRATATRMMEFTSTGNSGEGNVTLSAYVTVENTLPANDSIVTPLTVSASGTVSITGYYQAKDDDDLLLTLDASTLTVNVDPDAVQLNYNVLSQDSAPELTTLKPAATVLARQQMEQAARSLLLNINEIEDVKIHGNMLTCEIGHKDYTFRNESK